MIINTKIISYTINSEYYNLILKDEEFFVKDLGLNAPSFYIAPKYINGAVMHNNPAWILVEERNFSTIDYKMGFSKENQKSNQKRLDRVKELIDNPDNKFAVDLELRKNIITKAKLLSGTEQKKNCNIRIISSQDIERDNNFQWWRNYNTYDSHPQETKLILSKKQFITYYHDATKKIERSNIKKIDKSTIMYFFYNCSSNRENEIAVINHYALLDIIYNKTVKEIILDPKKANEYIELDWGFGKTLNIIYESYIEPAKGFSVTEGTEVIHLSEFMVHAENRGMSDEQTEQIKKLLQNQDSIKMAIVILNKINPAISLLELLSLSPYISGTIARGNNIEFMRITEYGYNLDLRHSYNLNNRVDKMKELYGELTIKQMEKIADTYYCYRTERSEYFDIEYKIKS